MKSNLKFSVLLIIMVFGLFAISCSGDGEDGEDGAPGTANVIYSGWLSPPAGAATIVDNTSGMGYNFVVPQITADIMSSGVVLAYLQFGTTDIFAMPYTSRAGGIVNTVEAIPSLGNLKIFRYRHDGETPVIPLGSTVKIRYIIIPGGTPAARQINYRDRSYEQVCDMLGIPK